MQYTSIIRFYEISWLKPSGVPACGIFEATWRSPSDIPNTVELKKRLDDMALLRLTDERSAIDDMMDRIRPTPQRLVHLEDVETVTVEPTGAGVRKAPFRCKCPQTEQPFVGYMWLAASQGLEENEQQLFRLSRRVHNASLSYKDLLETLALQFATGSGVSGAGINVARRGGMSYQGIVCSETVDPERFYFRAVWE